MPRHCSVCTHPKVRAINAAIRDYNSLRNIAARYGLSTTAVWRHARHHLKDVQPRKPHLPSPARPPRPSPKGTMKVYRALRSRNLIISPHAWFQDFLFRTDDSRVQEWLEHHPGFGTDVVLEPTSE